MDYIIIVLGIAMVLWGADKLTEGASAVATRMNIPQIIIGLTIVAFGTSMPEFCVSLVSALKGTTDIAIGNVVGSNIMNALLIVGVAAAVTPITILHSTVKKDIPFGIAASVLLIVLCLDKDLSRIDAAILFAFFLVFMFVTLKGAKTAGEPTAVTEEEKAKVPSYGKAAALIFIGLACLIIGSNFFVDSASNVARAWGVSDAVIGLTIVAGGTSLPELATSVVAAKKGQSAIAIGNVLGSNIFNILFILGITGLICPMSAAGFSLIDLGLMGGSMLLLWLFCFTKFRVERWEGFVLAAIYIAYIVWLVMNATATVAAN